MLLCVTMLAAGSMTAMAAVNSCGHDSHVKDGEPSVSYKGKSTSTAHLKILTYNSKCGICNLPNGTIVESFDEAHNYYLYDNLGYVGHSHNYRIHCDKCGESYQISIACPGGPTHSTPW